MVKVKGGVIQRSPRTGFRVNTKYILLTILLFTYYIFLHLKKQQLLRANTTYMFKVF